MVGRHSGDSRGKFRGTVDLWLLPEQQTRSAHRVTIQPEVHNSTGRAHLISSLAQVQSIRQEPFYCLLAFSRCLPYSCPCVDYWDILRFANLFHFLGISLRDIEYSCRFYVYPHTRDMNGGWRDQEDPCFWRVPLRFRRPD